MNQHLSHERISELLIESQNDSATNDEKAHLASCAECSADLAELRAAISTFGEAARDWSATQDSRQLQWEMKQEGRKKWWTIPNLGWGLAAAIVLLAVVWAPVHRGHESQHITASNAQNDEMLMQQIDAQLSRKVPTAMDPLANLISEDSSTNNTTGSKIDSQRQRGK